MNRTEKEDLVGQLKKDLEGIPGMVLADFTGMSVETTQALRRECRSKGITYRVIKNTLVGRAVTGTPLEAVKTKLKGPSSFVWGEDPVAVARLLVDFVKKNPVLQLKAAVLEGQALDGAGVQTLADMPTKPEIQSMVIGQFLSAGRNVAGQIKSPGGLLVSQIDKLIERLEKAA